MPSGPAFAGDLRRRMLLADGPSRLPEGCFFNISLRVPAAAPVCGSRKFHAYPLRRGGGVFASAGAPGATIGACVGEGAYPADGQRLDHAARARTFDL